MIAAVNRIRNQQWRRRQPDVVQADNSASYRGARITRLFKDWLPAHRSGDAAIADSRDLLLSRVRELCRDDAMLKAGKRALAKGVIGCGIQCFADALDAADRNLFDDEFNDVSDEVFERWSESHECDVRGRMTFPEMQWAAFNEIMEGGECFWLRVSDDFPGRSMPLAYQLLETEQLDRNQDWPAGNGRNLCRRGIEYNQYGRPLAYWIYDAHPFDDGQQWGSLSTSRRIPAERVIHSFIPNRFSENGGVTWFTNIQTVKDLDWYIGNELTAAALGALFTVCIKRAHGRGTGLGFTSVDGVTDNTSGNSEVRLGRGIIADLGQDDDVKIIESNRPNRDAAPFIKLINGLHGMATGVSPLRITQDYSQASYTSARAAHLDDQAFFDVLQEFMVSSAVRPIRKEHQRHAVAAGLIPAVTAAQYRREQVRLEAFFAQPPGREQLDPEMETKAALARIDGGLSTHAIECGKRGFHWRRMGRQRAREERFFLTVLGHQPRLNPTLQVGENTSQPDGTKPTGGDARSARKDKGGR